MSIYWSEGRYYFAPNAGLGVRQEETSVALLGSVAISCPDPNLTARRNPFCISAYFSNSRGRALVSARHGKSFGELTPLHHVPSPTGKAIRQLNAIQHPVVQSEGGRERTGHVGVRAPNEHSLHFSKLGGQFMHRDLAVRQAAATIPFGNKVIPTPAATQPRIASIEPNSRGCATSIPALLNRLSSLIRYEQPTRKTMVFSSVMEGRSSRARIERGVTKTSSSRRRSPVANPDGRPAPQQTRLKSAFNNILMRLQVVPVVTTGRTFG